MSSTNNTKFLFAVSKKHPNSFKALNGIDMVVIWHGKGHTISLNNFFE